MKTIPEIMRVIISGIMPRSSIGIIRNEKQYVSALRLVGDVIADLDREKRSKV